VRLGAREATEDWLERGRDLTNRGLAAPRLVVADGAPGLISAVEELWPRADRQHCAVHRLRNLIAKLPKSAHDRIRFNYWSALTRRHKRQGRQAPPPSPDLRTRAPRLPSRRPLPR
jgi:transposase-like protein